jgi:hypothetical protein
MTMSIRKIPAAVCIFLLLTAAGLAAQTVTPAPSPTPTPAPVVPPGPTPEPYTEDEFPEWVLDLRRAEIIFFGSLPFSFLLGMEGVEVGRYFAHGQDPAYQPFPFRSANPAEYTTEEKILIIGSALAISATVALIDFIIQKAARKPAAP